MGVRKVKRDKIVGNSFRSFQTNNSAIRERVLEKTFFYPAEYLVDIGVSNAIVARLFQVYVDKGDLASLRDFYNYLGNILGEKK